MNEKKAKAIGLVAMIVALGANLVSALSSKKEQEFQIEKAVSKYIAKNLPNGKTEG